MPQIVLRVEGAAQPVKLDAARLIAQYAVSGSDTLAVLDEDVPYEEQLHLVLFRNGRIIDHIEIGAPYATGEFRPIDEHGSILRFAFDGDDVWTLSVEAEGRRMFGGLPAGARRRSGFFAPRHLFLKRGGGGE